MWLNLAMEMRAKEYVDSERKLLDPVHNTTGSLTQ
jgi:hypothetical protein